MNLSNIPNDMKNILSFGIKLTLPDGRTLKNDRNNETILEGSGEVRQVNEKEIGNILKGFSFWKMESGRYIELNDMTNGHIQNSLNFLKRKELNDNADEFIRKFQLILRERNINDIINEDEDFGLNI